MGYSPCGLKEPDMTEQLTLIYCISKELITLSKSKNGASLVAQSVKILPAVQETQVQALVREDALEKEMANHSSISAWKIPWTEEPGRLQSMGSRKSRR